MDQGTYQGLGALNYGGGSMSPQNNTTQKRRQGGSNSNREKWIIIILLGLIAAVGLFILVQFILKSGLWDRETEEEYSVVGYWTCEDARDIVSALSDALEEEGMSETQALELLEACGLDNLDEDILFGFKEDGNIEIRYKGLGISVGLIDEIINFTYSEEDDKLLLQFTFYIPKLKDIPILKDLSNATISYLAEYEVGEEWMTIDFFGKELDFDRD